MQLTTKHVGDWTLLGERTPFLLSAESSDEAWERGLNLACALGDADLAVIHFLGANQKTVKAVARGPNLSRLHHSMDLACPEMFSLFPDSSADVLVLEDQELRRLQKALPAGCRSLVIGFRDDNDHIYALQLITTSDSSKLFLQAAILRSLGQTLIQIFNWRGQIEDLRTTAALASEASQAKSAFIANISHEIRTPLGVMLGFADLALDRPELSDETAEYISAIRRNGQLVTDILGEVLDLSKIEASRMEIEEIHFPLLPMLNEVILFLGLQAKDKGLQLCLERSGPLPAMVKTDPTRLRQILMNLIGNAVKFTEKGHVTLGVRMLSPPRAGTPVRLEFTVSDTGIGIPPKLKEKLFQPYTQLEVSTCRRFGGTGLGLTLSKQLVHALGGNLYLQQSEEGKGSTFVFEVGAGKYDGDSYEEHQTMEKVAGQPLQFIEDRQVFAGRRVLVVEDSQDIQMLVSRYLKSVGISVEVASNGFEGLAKISQGTYDLVVLDIQMPGMDGHEVARTLREKGFSRPIVALTAHAFKEEREKAYQNGFSEYLTKPINRAVLLKTLGERLAEIELH